MDNTAAKVIEAVLVSTAFLKLRKPI